MRCRSSRAAKGKGSARLNVCGVSQETPWRHVYEDQYISSPRARQPCARRRIIITLLPSESRGKKSIININFISTEFFYNTKFDDRHLMRAPPSPPPPPPPPPQQQQFAQQQLKHRGQYCQSSSRRISAAASRLLTTWYPSSKTAPRARAFHCSARCSSTRTHRRLTLMLLSVRCDDICRSLRARFASALKFTTAAKLILRAERERERAMARRSRVLNIISKNCTLAALFMTIASFSKTSGICIAPALEIPDLIRLHINLCLFNSLVFMDTTKLLAINDAIAGREDDNSMLSDSRDVGKIASITDSRPRRGYLCCRHVSSRCESNRLVHL
ncbi:unnamed protein product [Trichogramma brassicae]|uniref:Uncharacterized protein n=1 Tax=Trichogramma brassicae TaxID=86971 RepID=A0A6H5J4Q5_9HYME|nr:unnamed protein product [Trichogramma brassicae]